MATAPEEAEPLSFMERVKGIFSKPVEMHPRTVPVTGHGDDTFPENVIRNQKYSKWSFLPKNLYHQFKSFINFYYLVLTLSQLIPVLKVGPMWTYAAPLAFVVSLSIGMEAYLDIQRMLRDRQVNGEKYKRLTKRGYEEIPASDIQVGNFIQVETNRRIPADMILLRTSAESGASYIRTDQLDGETDWKLRKAVPLTQELPSDEALLDMKADLFAEAPKKDIYDFKGTLTSKSTGAVESLSLENTLWSSTVLASDTAIGVVVYTGTETRSVLNTNAPATKLGKLALEVNRLTMYLCLFEFAVAFALVAAGVFKGIWWLDFFRYCVLTSSIIPISMSVNMDMAKFVYAWLVVIDRQIPGCTVRNTTIPEELGRISYLMSDKTGTLTQNDMIFKKLNLGTINFSPESLVDIAEYVSDVDTGEIERKAKARQQSSKLRVKTGRSVGYRVHEAILALALCHNVTPVKDGEDEDNETDDLLGGAGEKEEAGGVSYQASSPDEVALVKFTETVGLTLWERTFTSITVKNSVDELLEFDILETFPFSSERKRMGIIVRNRANGEIRFIMKGADVIMADIVQSEDWLEEECDNLAREGLRTLVFGQKVLEEAEWLAFEERYQQAKADVEDRDRLVAEAIESIEVGLELLGLTGVEDKLQLNVRRTLESLRHAGVKIWMLTGDKRETATCIAVSSKLVARSQKPYQMEVTLPETAGRLLDDYSAFRDTPLIIDGKSLQIMLEGYKDQFFEATKNAPSVVCCRCSPTQKAEVVTLVKERSGKQVAAIGDGGNDVSMILAANIGIGIVGKEGKQASLASDYSIEQFSHVASLLLWHGRNSYLNSANLSQFIIFRGLAISFCQVFYSLAFYASPTVIWTGVYLVGYSCWNTMCPVFALCINKDIDQETSFLYPELYQDLRKGRALNRKTFLLWLLMAVYFAFAIIVPSLLIGPYTYVDFTAMTYTALVFAEMTVIALLVTRWNTLLVLSEVFTFASYPLVAIFLPGYYNLVFMSSRWFWIKVLMLTLFCVVPVAGIKFIVERISPPAHRKLQ